MTANTRKRLMKGLFFATLFGAIIGIVVIARLDPIRAVLLSVWGAGAVLTVLYVRKRVKRAYGTQWFDRTKHLGDEEKIWNEIRGLMNDEPLTYESEYRYPDSKWLPECIALVILASFFLSAAMLIVCGDLGGSGSDGVTAWALPVGVLALIGTVVTVFYQVRLTARTDNRKEWVGEIRGKMTDVIALSDRENGSAAGRKRTAREKITELELFLNPSEPLHRTFLALVRALHGIKDDFDEDVKSGMPVIFPKDQETGHPKPVSAEIWKARCIRISNVILKSEWERVKRAE